MSNACPDITINQLRTVSDWYIRDECYIKALAEIVNHHHRTGLVKNWGDGTTSSSDGQRFPTGNSGDVLGGYNAKYGSEPGVVFYTHISDQYSPFYTRVIYASQRDATFLLDGLLNHESELNIEEHFTDTLGFTDQIFLLCHILGFKFAPRIKDIKDTRIFTLDGVNVPKIMEVSLGNKIREKDIESQWNDILRLATSIKIGTTQASLGANLQRDFFPYPF